jgi:polyisoprenoid-binding protein YceI
MFRLNRNLTLALTLTVAFVLSLAVQAQAAPAGDWNAVKARIESAKDYTLKYDYSSERGVLKFDYSVSLAGPRIRTEVLRGSSRNVGSVVVYDPSFAADKVRAKIGMGRITRGLDHPDVVGTPFFQPLFTMILNELKSYPTMKVTGSENVRGQQATVYEFSGTSATEYRVWVNASHEMVRTEKKRAGKVIETRDFRQIRWNCNPKVGF